MIDTETPTGPAWHRAPQAGHARTTLPRGTYRFVLIVLAIAVLGAVLAVATSTDSTSAKRHIVALTVTSTGPVSLTFYWNNPPAPVRVYHVDNARVPWTKTLEIASGSSTAGVAAHLVGTRPAALACSLSVDGRPVWHDRASGSEARVACDGLGFFGH
jgi:hypothetical protein